MGPGYQPPGGGGGYNLPPSGPGPQGHLPMGHGPSPYQNGTPPIQQEGSGMTPEGGRKRAVICGCNYKCGMRQPCCMRLSGPENGVLLHCENGSLAEPGGCVDLAASH